jgi:hypothetical protein
MRSVVEWKISGGVEAFETGHRVALGSQGERIAAALLVERGRFLSLSELVHVLEVRARAPFL